jgi:hypothetical protein
LRPVKIVNYSHGADTGGQSWRIKDAFDKHSEMQYRSIVRNRNYIMYPRDLAHRYAIPEMRKADVLHVNDSFQGLGGYHTKPLVVHFHGTKFRNNTSKLLGEMRNLGALGLVSTLDLVVAEDLAWLPTPHDVQWLRSLRAPIDDGVYRIGHAPTSRAVKSTEHLIAAVERLAKEMPVELVLSERLTWEATLARKATVDVFFDQVLLGYGNNAVEAWGMGIPVICGAQPNTLSDMWNLFGELPFYQATEETIYEAIRALADPEIRQEWADRGTRFVERFHDYPVVVEVLEGIYRQRAA